MITGKTSGILSEKAAVDLHNVLIEASQWIKVHLLLHMVEYISQRVVMRVPVLCRVTKACQCV